MTGLIVLVVLVLFALFLASRTVRIIPQARAGVVERLGPLQPHAAARVWPSLSPSSTACGR